MVSLPDEAKIKAEINRLIESDNEDDEIVERIEGAHIVRLNAEKDDNQQLKKQVTSLQTNLRRATLRGNVNPADFAEQLIAANAAAAENLPMTASVESASAGGDELPSQA